MFQRTVLLFAAGLSLAGLPLPAASNPDEPPPAATVPDGTGLILTALREKRLLVFRYEGHERTVEPHACGRTRDGTLALLAFQVAGASESAPPPGWRLFHVPAMQELRLHEDHFAGARPDFARGDKRLAVVIAEVE